MNLQNLLDYQQEFDLPSIFEGVDVPTPIDRDLVISYIMLRCGLLTPIYNEPNTFRLATKIWFQSHKYHFEHLINILEAEYSPIENVFEVSEETTKHDGINEKRGSYQDTEGIEQNDTSNNTMNDENKVSAFNSNQYASDNKSETITDETSKKEIDRVLDNIHADDEKTSYKDEYKKLRHGNIGVTTNEQLQKGEVSWLEQFNVYDWIASQFENDNMILSY